MILGPTSLDETSKDFDSVRFGMNRVNPSVSSALIDECNLIV